MSELHEAIEALKAGRAVIFPTDTVYGLGVAPRFAESPQEVFELKRRPADKPVAWLIGGVDDLDRYGSQVSDKARALVAEGWPGALTVIVKASEAVPQAFRSAQGTIGLRVPDSEIALKLIREVGPLAASSANRTGENAPRSFGEIDASLLDEAAAVITSNEHASGTASTVVNATGSELVVLRP